MRRKPRVFPEHLCLSCSRTTTNRSYCDTCLKLMTRPKFAPRELWITVPKGPTIWRRKETLDGGITG